LRIRQINHGFPPTNASHAIHPNQLGQIRSHAARERETQ
jgi:hypothetical protein